MREEYGSNPLISVIIPVYNIADYIQKCIESIIKQTYNNLEIILVDDGSSDISGKICDQYAKNDPRIIVFHKENGGLSDARNYGIERAHGELLGFVDGDDRIHPQMYEIMLSKMLLEEADLVTCWFEQHDDMSFEKAVDINSICTKIISASEALIDIETPLVVAWNKLYKRTIFTDLRYPIGKVHEDEYVIHKIIRKCKKIVVIDYPLYFYTIRQGSIVANMNEQRINDALEALRDRIAFADMEKWNDVMPAVVKRYCDYCIDRYYDIQSGRYIIPREVKEGLWKAEHDMCEKYLDVQIDERYRKFAISPIMYERFINKKSVKKKINDLVRRLF